ncbi:hypothetical protein WHR41_00673 [Cladosporium halotolerans]|uniref:Uncharacterized protein n=1 Tax=Cladosporium halotolerans TaxID=1052096 RepID=A0AB34L3K0_9PEZI
MSALGSTSTHSPAATPDQSSIRLVSDFPSHRRSLSNISTGYNGAQGLLDDDANSTENTALTALAPPDKAYTPERPAIGARLLSSIQNAQPTAAALSRSKTVLHSRARSLAAFVPRLSPSAPSQSSPADPRPQTSHNQSSNRLFGDLFNGESAPVRLGIPPSSPNREKEEMEFPMEYRSGLTERPRKRASMLPQTPERQKTSWFGRKVASPSVPQSPAVAQDDIVNMNIMASLFPNGQTDELTPHAFNDLLVNATTLLQKMQSAYKEKVDYIATMQPEIEVQREEVEEAEIRSRHLKLQLEDMGRRAQEQEKAMQELASQLSEERFRHQEAREKEARKISRSFKLAPPPPSASADDTTDDETTPRRRKRASAGSTDASDSGFESDMDRDAEGQWSQDPMDPVMQKAVLSSPAPITPTKPRHQHAPTHSSNLRNSVSAMNKRLGSDGSAWTMMERLRGENVELRAQVAEMQRELQACIELIGCVR